MCTLAIQNEFEDALIAYNKTQAISIFNDFLSSHKANVFIDQVMVAVMDRIGTQWEKGELSLSQVYSEQQTVRGNCGEHGYARCNSNRTTKNCRCNPGRSPCARQNGF